MTSFSAPVAPPYLFGSGRRRPDALILQSTPSRFGSYVEPQLGSGTRAIVTMRYHPEARFVLNSTHSELLVVWQVLLGGADELVDAVTGHAQQHDREHFAAVSRWGATGELASKSAADRAARFVYLSGTARGTARAGLLDDFASAELSRDTVAFDAANLRSLATLLADRDVQLDARPLFDLLPAINEDDFVFVDRDVETASHRPAAQPSPRELRSFVGSVTAKGASMLVTGHPLDHEPGGAASWPGVTRLQTGLDRRSETSHEQALWANGLLVRSLRRGSEAP